MLQTPRTLPAELQDMVMDHLRGDRATLRACALVCKAWLPRSRSNLLNCVDIHSEHAGDLLLDTFLQNPDLCRHVRVLVVRAPLPWQKLAHILSSLKMLECFILDDTDESEASSDHVWIDQVLAALFSMTELRTLRIQEPFFTNEYDCRILAQACSSAGLARLESVFLHDNLEDAVVAPLLHGIARAKQATRTSIPLSFLECELCIANDKEGVALVEAFNDVVQSAGWGLEELILHFDASDEINTGYTWTNVMNRLQLDGFSRLRKLELIFSLLDPPVRCDPDYLKFNAAAAMLSAIPHTAPLEKLFLTIEDHLREDYVTYRHNDGHIAAWRELDIAISDLRHLTSLTLRHYVFDHTWNWLDRASVKVIGRLKMELTQSRQRFSEEDGAFRFEYAYNYPT